MFEGYLSFEKRGREGGRETERERERSIIRDGICIETHYTYCYYYSGERQNVLL
jgi:hypothetical protein